MSKNAEPRAEQQTCLIALPRRESFSAMPENTLSFRSPTFVLTMQSYYILEAKARKKPQPNFLLSFTLNNR